MICDSHTYSYTLHGGVTSPPISTRELQPEPERLQLHLLRRAATPPRLPSPTVEPQL